ncbi:MAG: class I SAM-dependent methyltransferase [Nitriliruptoraceae bacterium]|nr:class I SAM-dependent methyltransferase [Nitriliruptoraceae bacterium]
MDATGWDERYRDTELVWSAGPNTFVERELSGYPRGRALDLAAGEGRNALWLAEQGFEVEAVEFSAVAIDKGRAIAQRRGVEVTWTAADLTSAPQLDPADVVVLAYLQLPVEPLAAIHRHVAHTMVRPGGTVLVVAHARRNVTDGHGGPSAPEVCPTVEEVTSALTDGGLAVVHAGEVTREVATDHGSATAIDVLVRATHPAA